MTNKVRFIAIDGPDGGGKGTQVILLAKKLLGFDKKNHVFLTREPYKSAYYDKIREILRTSTNPKDYAEELSELFVKDRKVHCAVILEFLAQGIIVISDRYKYSTLAYQWTQGVDLQRLINMHSGLLVPDLTILLDIPAEVALERIAKDQGREYKEVFEKIEFQNQLRENFLALPKYLSEERIVIIDGDAEVGVVEGKIWREVEKIL